MLTVLIRYKKTGIENIRQVAEVEFYPVGSTVEPGPSLFLRQSHIDRDGTMIGPSEKNDENWRDVFVMNDKGATVARYAL